MKSLIYSLIIYVKHIATQSYFTELQVHRILCFLEQERLIQLETNKWLNKYFNCCFEIPGVFSL